MDKPTVPVIVHSELQTPKEDHGLTMQGRGLRRACSKKRDIMLPVFAVEFNTFDKPY